MKTGLNDAIEAWPHVAKLLQSPKADAEYDELVDAMKSVLDAGGADETHPLAGLVELISELVEEYDNKRYGAVQMATGVELLSHFIQDRGLTPSDLPEIGSPGVVSEILSGKREFTVGDIHALAERFGVPAGYFL